MISVVLEERINHVNCCRIQNLTDTFFKLFEKYDDMQTIIFLNEKLLVFKWVNKQSVWVDK